MKNFDVGRSILFILALLVIGVLIHESIKTDVPPTMQGTFVPSPPQVTPPPVISISRIWPEGASPNKVVRIPDPQIPAKGLMNILLHPGDDVELDFDSLWIFGYPQDQQPSGIEMVVNPGVGFESMDTYQNNRNNDGNSPSAWWTQPRIYRIRPAPGISGAVSFALVINKLPVPQPLPLVLPQHYHDLTISYDGLRGMPDRSVLVYLTFHNDSRLNILAVAMYDQGCRNMPCNLQSSLVASDGTPYVTDTTCLTGINGLRTSPQYLTSIEPGQDLKTSVKFFPRGAVSDGITSVRLQFELVVNENFRDGEYLNFRESGQDVVPPYCRVINVIFDIPIRRSDQ